MSRFMEGVLNQMDRDSMTGFSLFVVLYKRNVSCFFKGSQRETWHVKDSLCCDIFSYSYPGGLLLHPGG